MMAVDFEIQTPFYKPNTKTQSVVSDIVEEYNVCLELLIIMKV